MTVSFSRRTVAANVRFEGLGLHSGVPVSVMVRPGNSGIVFYAGGEKVQAKPENVSETRRCTRIGPVSTIEHLMSALGGLEITDADIEVEGGECPGLDGSSVEYVRAFQNAGTQEIGTAQMDGLFTRVLHREGDLSMGIAKGSGHWRYAFMTGERWPGAQIYETKNIVADYPTQIAPARTIGFEEELPFIREMGLAKGLDLDKAIILGKEGYMTEPRFADEPARHKLLDGLGDLFLAGIPPSLLDVTMERTGHDAHVRTALRLSQSVKIAYL